MPSDYDELSTRGQVLARINACRLWTLRTPRDTPDDLARRLIASTDFFDKYYLWPDDEDDFDPAFYDMPPLPTPAIHWALSRLWACERLSVAVAPRGSAKTTHGRKDITLRLITEPKYSFVYATSSIDNARITGEMIRFQCYENRRIQDDWRIHYDSDSLKPGHGAGMRSSSHFKLVNGSSLRVVSANSKLRGMRPRRFRLDDPEHDAKQSTDMVVLRRYIQELVFRVVLPAVTRPNVACDWTATYVSPKHFAPHAMQVVRDADGVERAADPRFDMWGRLFIPGAYRDETGRLVSCWPEMWPIDEAERAEKGLAGAITHDEMKVMMGPTAYNIEILGELKHGEDAYFKVDPSPQGKHAFWFTDVDELLRDSPTLSNATINFIRGIGADAVTVTMPIKDFLAVSRLFMTVDSAYTETLHSDRRVCTLMGITPENELFVLDMWSDQKGDDMLANRAFAMAEKWRCPVIYVEVVKETIATYKRFQSLAHTRATEVMGHVHVPAIKDMKPGMMSKVGKISALDVRVEYGLLKMPIISRATNPAIGRLLDQLDGFSPEVQDGGLAKDDEIDCYPLGTPVITARGEIPIEDVTTDDHVLTAAGWKPVLENASTSVQPVITRFGITATPHHPIWTLNRGYVELDSLDMTDIIVACPTASPTPGPRPAPENQDTQPPGTEGSSTGTQPPSEEPPTTSGATSTGRPPSPSTEPCGNTTTAQSPPTTRSTTATATPSTTTPQTSSACGTGSTPDTTSTTDSSTTTVDRRSDPTWRASVRSRLNGIAPPRDVAGIVRTLDEAVSVQPSLPPNIAPGSFIVCSAGELTKVRRQAATSTAAPSVDRPPTGKPSDVIEHGSVPTRCLRVADVSQFFAGGVLGSNTVAMSMMVIKGRHHGRLPETPQDAPKELPPVDVLEEIKGGKKVYEVSGRPLTEGIDPRMLDEEAIAIIMEAAAGKLRNTKRRGSAV